jgi:hypothetical protein
MKDLCHICGVNGNRMVDCPRFNKMKNMFEDNTKLTKNQLVNDKETPITSIDMVVVATHGKKNEEQVFKE